jgi:hypothetical protein
MQISAYLFEVSLDWIEPMLTMMLWLMMMQSLIWRMHHDVWQSHHQMDYDHHLQLLLFAVMASLLGLLPRV